jgi:outer membrane protein
VIRRFLAIFFLIVGYQQLVHGQNRSHREIVDVGNGMKVEILDCTGEGADKDCDVIYYTDRRQNGKRQIVKLSAIRAQQKAARDAKIAATTNTTAKQDTKPTTATDKQVKTEKKTPVLKKDTVLTATKVNTPVKKVAVQQPEKNEDTSGVGNVADLTPFEIQPALPISKDVVSTPPNPDLRGYYNVNPVSKYSLAQCFQLALARNNSLKQAKNKIAMSALDRKAAWYGLFPSVSYNLEHYFSFGKNIDPVTNTFVNESFSGGFTGLNMQMQIFSGFRKLNTIKQSSYMLKSSEAEMKKVELELLTNVALTYARLLLNKEQLAFARANLISTSRQLDVINEKIRIGRLTRYDAYAFNARMNTEQANLISYKNDSAIAMQDLRQLLNLDRKTQFDVLRIDSSSLSVIASTTVYAEDFIDSVLMNHPAMVQAKMDEQVAQYGLKIARSNKYPSLSLGGNVSTNYNVGQTDDNDQKIPVERQLDQNLGQNVFINLRIPIFSQLQNSNRIRREKMNVTNAEINRQEAENTIVKNTMQLLNDFNFARQRYIATLQARDHSVLSFSMYEEKHRLGQISSMEILSAHDNLNSAVSQYLQAKLELYFKYQLLLLLKS